MGVRFSGTFKPYIDDGSEEVQVEIIDINGGGNLPIRIEGVRIYGETEAREPADTISGGRAEVSFVIEDASYESFITDLGAQITDRFYVKLISKGYDFFVGVVTHDNVEWDDAAYPFFFTVNAIDGVSRLKDISYLQEDGTIYEGDITYDYYISAMDHIFNCFSKLNLDQIYDTSYDTKRIWVHDNWYASNMADMSGNPLEQWYIHPSVFFDYDNEGNVIPMNCYDVLENILKPKGLSIKFGRGIYRIDQWPNRDPEREFYWNYNFDGTPSGTRTQTWRRFVDQEQIYTKANGRFGMIPALRQVKVIYKYDLDATATEPPTDYAFGAKVVGAGAGTSHKVCLFAPQYVGAPTAVLGALGDFNVNEEQNPVVFRVHFQLMIRSTYLGLPEDYVPHSVKITVWLGIQNGGTQFGGRTGIKIYRSVLDNTFGDPQRSAPSWEDNVGGSTTLETALLGGWDYMTEPIWSDYEPETFYLDVGFETTDFPEDIESFASYLCVGLNRIVGPGGATTFGSDYEIEYSVSDLTVIYAQSNTRAKPTVQTVEALSTVNEGGKGEKTIEVLVGDRGSTTKVDDGTGLVTPLGWGVNGGGTQELAELLAEKYHEFRGIPRLTISRGFIGRENFPLDHMNSLDYCGHVFVPMETEHDMYRQEIRGTWFSAVANAVPVPSLRRLGTVYSDYNRLDEKPRAPYVGSKLQDRGRDGDGFTAPTTKFIVTAFDLPVKADLTVEEIRRILTVYLNGNKLEYIDTIPGSQGNTWHTIDNTDNSIVVSTNFPLTARDRIEVFLG